MLAESGRQVLAGEQVPLAWQEKAKFIGSQGHVDALVSAELSAAHAGEIGDVKSFSYDASDAIGIRNDKRGEAAL